MQELTTIVSSVMSVLRTLTLLGIPIIIWEIFLILIRVVVRILFGATTNPSKSNKED